MYLSKSKYCRLTQCAKMFWLDKNHPEVKTVDPSREDRMTIGNEVGDLAMGLFGDFTEVTTVREDGSLDISAMLEKTNACIKGGTEVICEASFSYEGLYCAVDILRRQDDGYAIYEVKSASHVSPIYGVDIAYQKYVLEHCGIKVTGTYLVCINSSYIRGEELDIQQLFKIVDMSEAVTLETPLIPSKLRLAEKTLAMEDEPTIDLGCHCRDPYKCEYWNYCARHLPEPSVFDLYKIRFDTALKCYHQGLRSYQDMLSVPKLNDKQLRQIQFELTNPADDYVNKGGVRDFLNTLFYPMYFLDFESMQQVIPQYPGTWAYQQIPFQYSLHYIEYPGGPLLHKEFLAVSGENPLRAIAESLCCNIPTNACVLAYYKSFECGRVKELAKMFPDLANHLMCVHANIRDLLDPFQSGYYYNRAMGGSFSIKVVLPALFPDDPELDYHNLEGIHNGGEAMTAFPKIKDLPPEEQEIVRRNLLDYCKLDTYAMVKIWEKLVEAAK